MNPIERKLEIMGTITKRVKIMDILVNKTFQEMRSDYSEHNYENFHEYRNNFETMEYLAKNLVADPASKKEED